MIVSELWSGWFDDWGNSRHNGKPAASLDWQLHELLAVGASGYSHWVWAGGTNFANWGGRTVGGDTIHMAASYDYDAPVDEYGQPTRSTTWRGAIICWPARWERSSRGCWPTPRPAAPR